MKVYRVTYYGSVRHPFMPVEHVEEGEELVQVVRTYDPDDTRYRKVERDHWAEGNRTFAYDELKVGRKVPVFSVLVPIEGIMDREEAEAKAESMLIEWLKSR